MRRLLTFFAVAVLTMSAAAANAGVILEQEILINGQMAGANSKRTVMIEGHKQKVTTSRNSVITDLDRGLVIVLVPARKIYVEMPFPPTEPSGKTMQDAEVKASYKKTDKQKTLNGYKCDEYVGSGRMMMADFTVTGCFSKDAPGAADYTAYDKALEAKLNGTSTATPGSRPEGVPMVIERATRIRLASIPDLTPEQAKAMADQPPHMTNTRTTSVKSATLPADTFTVPAGYTKSEPRKGRPPGAPMGTPGKPGAVPKAKE